MVTLTRNYRSTQPILDVADAVWADAAHSYPKRLQAVREGGVRPRLVFCLDPATGKVFWHYDELSQGGPEKKGYAANLLSSLTVEVRRTRKGDERRIYFASSVGGSNAVVFCLEDEWVDEEKE